MNHIFLSYSRKDKTVMQQVQNILIESGIEVWTDENLTPGTSAWENAIGEAIEEASALVVLLSPDSKKSEWVGREIAFGETHQKLIIPFLIQGTEKDAVPFRLVSYQRIDAVNDFTSGMVKLVLALKEKLKNPENQEKTLPVPKAPKSKLTTNQLLMLFWQNLQRLSVGRVDEFTHLTPGERYYLGTSAGRSGFSISYNITRMGYGMTCYIDTGDMAQNKAYFDALYTHKDEIEREIQTKLNWRRIDDKRGSRIDLIIEEPPNFDFRNPDTWDELHLCMIDSMGRFNETFRNWIKKISI